MPGARFIIVGTEGIDRGSGLPLYLELTRKLRRQIERGELHGAMPSEMELAAQWQVSKTTVRKALRELRRAGLVETYHGHGSRVVPPEERPG